MDQWLSVDNYSLLACLFLNIKNRSADHDNFAKACKGELVDELSRFAGSLFNLAEDDWDGLNSHLEDYSKVLNIQVKIYMESGILHIKKNLFTDALVVSIYQKCENENYIYYTLYHKDFKTISIQSLNLAADFESQKVDDEIAICQELIGEIFQTIKNNPSLIEPGQWLREEFYQLKRKVQKTWTFEEILTGTCKCYIVLFEKCFLCGESSHRYVFACGCKFCEVCLHTLPKSGPCLSCQKQLTSPDIDLINKSKSGY